MISLAFYLEASLTTPVDGNMVLEKIIDGDPPELRIYLGSKEADRQFSNNANPGDPIQVFVSGGAGGSFGSSDFVLAASQADLDTNAPGATLELDGTLLSGSANAVPVWIRFVGDPDSPELQEDLLLQTNELIEESTD